MTLAVGSKGSRGWRSLGKPCMEQDKKTEKKRERQRDFYFVSVTELRMISPKLTWQQDEEALRVL